jgi:hypothetical protein
MAKDGVAAIRDSGVHQWHVIAHDENSGHTQPTSAASRQAPGSVTSWPRLIINATAMGMTGCRNNANRDGSHMAPPRPRGNR